MVSSNTAAWIDAPYADLQVRDADTPTPGVGQLLVQVRAVAVNPLDAVIQSNGKMMHGWLSYPVILGEDVAGIVTGVGAGVTGFAVGDRVVAYAMGLVAIAAIAYAGRIGVVQANSGNELTLPAIAAVLVGGTSVLGGSGGVIRTLIGLSIIAVLQNGVVLLGVPSLLNGVLIGSALVLAVAVDVLARRALDRRIEGIG